MQGSGCGRVEIEVANRGSIPVINGTLPVDFKLYWSDENKEKEAGNAALKM